ncbi:GPI mannosyltransferase, partial [Protomyces lactucae-debilis]
RLLSAQHNIIHDTDETYNYWEPLHFLLHGTGFQTWEYSPVYAIRSWTYICLHALPLYPLKDILSREQQFYLLRCILGAVSAFIEASLVMTISKANEELGLLTLAGLLTSAGMFTASTALLPSTFTLYTCTLGLDLFLRQHHTLSTAAFAIGVIIGWPFSILLFIPLVLINFMKPLYSYVRGTIIALQVLLIATVIDYFFYRRWAIVPLNIILYNVFQQGPELFGVEAWSYYFKNLLLNFNFLFPLALLGLPLAMLSKKKFYIQCTAGFALWFSVFTLQPHKEERFMYPAYPALVLSASISLELLFQFTQRITDLMTDQLRLPQHLLPRTMKLFVLVLSALISIYRITDVTLSYRAPLLLFPRLPPGKEYCMGSDWYRFPTSFILPDDTALSFIESSFRGLLPGKFNTTDSIPHMNNLNQWDATKVIHEGLCECLV